MTIRNVILLLVLMYAAKSIAADCRIETWSKIFYSNKNEITSNDVIKNSSCDNQTNFKFIKSLIDFDGKILTSYLKDDLPQVDIIPSSIVIQSINNLLNQKFDLDHNYLWDNATITNKNVITLNDNQNISISVKDTKLGRKTIMLQINDPIQSSDSKLWVTATLKAKIKALVAKSHMSSSYGELNKNLFDTKDVFTEYPERVFSDFRHLNHYRLNRPLSKGSTLKSMDISSLALVHIGVPVKIVHQANGILLNGKAVPMKMGKYGDLIQLRPLNSKKIITGKVVDYNKVIIEL